jgi:predicted RNase H-like HicB family nuclease
LKAHANSKAMKFTVETEQEKDGRWIAEVIDLPGVLVYAQTCEDAITQVQALALRVLAERLEQGETESGLVSVSFQAA